MEGVRTTGMPAALGAMSKRRATLNGIPPHQAYGRPNYARVDPQIPIHSLGYPIQQVECEQFMGRAPILAPQPGGAADAESWVFNDGQGIAGIQRNDWWFRVPFDDSSAFGLEISGGSSSGIAGALVDERYVGYVDEGGRILWTMSTAATGEYGAQAQLLPGYTQGPQPDHSPYHPQTRGYIEQNGGGGELEYCHSRDQCLTIWS